MQHLARLVRHWDIKPRTPCVLGKHSTKASRLPELANQISLQRCTSKGRALLRPFLSRARRSRGAAASAHAPADRARAGGPRARAPAVPLPHRGRGRGKDGERRPRRRRRRWLTRLPRLRWPSPAATRSSARSSAKKSPPRSSSRTTG